jgi:hypothetical protein
MPSETVLTNARVVTRDAVLDGASVAVRGGVILAVDTDRSSLPGAVDLGGDLLIPGLVELHTDNLEKHYSPRIGVVWDPVSAAVAHDVQCAGFGITTVYDSLVLGAAPGWEMRDEWLRPMLEGLASARSSGMLKVDHRLHLRCEVTHPDIVPFFERFLASRAWASSRSWTTRPATGSLPTSRPTSGATAAPSGWTRRRWTRTSRPWWRARAGTPRGTAATSRRLLGRVASRSPATTTRARSTSWKRPSWAPC